MEETIEDIKQRIREAISKKSIGRDHIDAVYLEGLAAGLYFWKLMDNTAPHLATNLVAGNSGIAKQLGLELNEIDLSEIEIVLPVNNQSDREQK
jgi:hypothetical protein